MKRSNTLLVIASFMVSGFQVGSLEPVPGSEFTFHEETVDDAYDTFVSGEPAGPPTVFYARDAGKFGGELVADPSAESGWAVRVSPAAKLYGEIVLQGLGGTFGAGTYVVTYFIRTDGGLGSDRTIVELEVARRKAGDDGPFTVTDFRGVTGVVFSCEDVYSAIPVYVSLGEPAELDFRVRYIGNAVLYMERVTVEEIFEPDG